jgi:hypothetical protein
VKLKIVASTLITRHYLSITDQGVEFCETAALGSPRRFRFEQIEAVLQSVTSVLSFQVGRETFRIPIRPHNAMHRAAVARLVSEARRTVRYA